MTLRVIAGSAKGRRLKDVPGDTTRPITDKVKQALFNILGPDVEDSKWWDVFGGTGAIGIEALSRGAAFVQFCELNRLPAEVIKINLGICGFLERSDVLRINAFSKLTSTPDQSFDYIYIAPPQYHEYWVRALLALDTNRGWLVDHGMIIVQIHPREDNNMILNNYLRFDERKYGSTKLIFFERR